MHSATQACLVGIVALLIAGPVPARADGYVTPWVGLNVASPSDTGRPAIGVTTGYMGAGVFGFEADVGFSRDLAASSLGRRADSAINAMGNFILGVPIGGTDGAGVRPFVTGGFGVVRTHIEFGDLIEVSRSNNAFDYSLGVGMMGFFNHHLGLRGDVRYLRTLQDTNLGQGVDLDPGRLATWRLTGGVTFR